MNFFSIVEKKIFIFYLYNMVHGIYLKYIVWNILYGIFMEYTLKLYFSRATYLNRNLTVT